MNFRYCAGRGIQFVKKIRNNYQLEVEGDLPSSFACYSTLIFIFLTVVVGLCGACFPEL